LQKSGRIGRIEVQIDIRGGKAEGSITIPSSMDMAETAIVASALETIQRIGPCNAKIHVESIEDVRITKRGYVIERAKELLRGMIDKGPESGEMMEEIKQSVRGMEIIEYGSDKLPAGPGIKESDELIIVEGRADVITLLKNGFRNVIGLNGTSVPPSIADLAKTKTSTVFVDGDRGGKLIVKELISVTDIDFVAIAPTGKEVEELTKKEIHQCLRAQIPVQQFKDELGDIKPEQRPEQREQREVRRMPQSTSQQTSQPVQPQPQRKMNVHPEYAKQFKKMLDELTGTRGAYLLDSNMNILGKVPIPELGNTLRNLPDVETVVMDGQINPDIIKTIEHSSIATIVGESSIAQSRRARIITAKDLE
jgi:DNA primase